MNENQAPDEIARIGRNLFERGYVHASAGNLSVRLDGGGFPITPSDGCLGFLNPARPARLDAKLRLSRA
jgi:ribulose-5-phosphate 4-epimerase/fuculose-1-phosphate aldolase